MKIISPFIVIIKTGLSIHLLGHGLIQLQMAMEEPQLWQSGIIMLDQQQ
jgi:hypothetical protein